MAIRINTNVAAMNALRNVDQASAAFNKSITKLSTGLRITNAADDPAGLIISEKLRAQIAGLNQAVSNAQDGTNLMKTAEGALDEVNTLLKDARNLAVQASNTGSQDAASLQAIQNQLNSIVSSIDRIANTTAFGNKKLLDGSAGASIALADTSKVSAISLSGTFAGEAVASGVMSVDRTTAATKVTMEAQNTFSSLDSLISAGSIVLNGVSISTDGTQTLSDFIYKINQYSGQTGVTATQGTIGTYLNVDLKQNTYGSRYKVELQDTSGIINTATYSSLSGVDAKYTVKMVTYNSAGATAVQTSYFTGGVNAGDSGTLLRDKYGNSILITDAGNGIDAEYASGTVTANLLNFQVGSEANQVAKVAIGNIISSNLGTTAVSGKNLSNLDLTTASGAADAIKVIDEAISQVSKQRGDIGSFQRNVLDSTVRSLNIAKENLSATESAIRDVDVAAEITEFTKMQILQQSGLAVLAQANSAPQGVLSLLRG